MYEEFTICTFVVSSIQYTICIVYMNESEPSEIARDPKRCPARRNALCVLPHTHTHTHSTQQDLWAARARGIFVPIRHITQMYARTCAHGQSAGVCAPPFTHAFSYWHRNCMNWEQKRSLEDFRFECIYDIIFAPTVSQTTYIYMLEGRHDSSWWHKSKYNQTRFKRQIGYNCV